MNQEMLPGMDPNIPGPETEDDWLSKWIEICDLFSPNSPVHEQERFSGRQPQLAKIIETVFQAGQHAVIYGDRGVGKTSLVTIGLQKIFVRAPFIKMFPVQCFQGNDFVDIWMRAFKDHKWPNGDYAIDDIDDSTGPDDIYNLVSKFSLNDRPIIAFDEFDRIIDQPTKTKMAETIKLLSDRSSGTTILIAGVGRTIRDLISEHESIRRALRQVEVPRMTTEEIKEIVSIRIQLAGMTISPKVLGTIVWLSNGMPGYAHLLGKYSAKVAIDEKSLIIGLAQLIASLDTCLEETFESTRHAYSRGIQSSRPNNTYRETLLACATAPHSEFGSFIAAAVRKPLSDILGEERSIPDYNRHLKAFTTPERGPVLEREGSPKNYQYRFIDPMMQSYVITRGVRDGLLPTS